MKAFVPITSEVAIVSCWLSVVPGFKDKLSEEKAYHLLLNEEQPHSHMYLGRTEPVLP